MRRSLFIGGTAVLLAASVGIRASVSEERTPAEKAPLSPIQVSFEAPTPPELNKPVEVTLVVQINPKVPVRKPIDGKMEVLLRLPAGVRLASPKGWQPVKLPPNEKGDVSGPWNLFERVESVSLPAAEGSQSLARVTILLQVVEEGVNWVITTRVRVTQGTESWQNFGVLFATLQGNKSGFHLIPRTTLSDAEANRS